MKKLFLILSAMLILNPTKAQNWTSISTPVSTNLILYQSAFPAGQNTIGYMGGSSSTYNGKGKILKSTDSGDSWSVIWEDNTNGTGVSSLWFHNDTVGIAGTQGGNIMTTTDGGANWTSTDFDLSTDQGEIRAIKFFDANNGVLVSGWNGIYRTTDGGANWTVAATNFIGGQDVSYADAQNVFVCGNGQKIARSTDGGSTWSVVYTGPNAAMQWVNLGVEFYDANNGMVVSEEGQYFKTTDGGSNWAVGTIPDQWGLMRGIYWQSAQEIYVCATPGQVFRTIDGGVNWTDDSGVNPQPSYYSIHFTPDGTGFVSGSGSTGGTILKRSVPVDLGEIEIQELTVFPSPASDVLNINIPSSMNKASLEVRVIDMSGKTVFTKEVSGRNTANVSVSGLESGMYTVQLHNGVTPVAQNRFNVVK